jgi:hypothetical protein
LILKEISILGLDTIEQIRLISLNFDQTSMSMYVSGLTGIRHVMTPWFLLQLTPISLSPTLFLDIRYHLV